MILFGGIMWYRDLKDTYFLKISTAGNETKVLESQGDAKYIEQVAKALNEAIISRAK